MDFDRLLGSEQKGGHAHGPCRPLFDEAFQITQMMGMTKSVDGFGVVRVRTERIMHHRPLISGKNLDIIGHFLSTKA